MLIRVMVPAEDKEEALEKAELVGDRLTEGPNHQSDFDYYKTLDHDPGEFRVAGADRWGHDIPSAALIESEEGEELVEEGWKYSHEYFERAIERCRLVIEHLSDEEIREEKFDELPDDVQEKVGSPLDVRMCFRLAAGYEPVYNYLFDRHGNPIRRREELENLKEAVSDSSDRNQWVVPLDVHH